MTFVLCYAFSPKVSWIFRWERKVAGSNQFEDSSVKPLSPEYPVISRFERNKNRCFPHTIKKSRMSYLTHSRKYLKLTNDLSFTHHLMALFAIHNLVTAD